MSSPPIHVFRVFGLRRTTTHRSKVIPPVDLHRPQLRVDHTWDVDDASPLQEGDGDGSGGVHEGEKGWNTVRRQWQVGDDRPANGNAGEEGEENTRTKPTLVGYKEGEQISGIFPFQK